MTWKCRQKDYHKYIDDYIDGCRKCEIIVGKDILAALDVVESKLNNEDVFIDIEKIDKSVELMERYFEISLFDWELFVTACIHCFYKANDTVVFDTIFIMMGRGNGKNGFISPLVWYLTTHYHGIKGYNIDIVANAEDQAKTSFEDVYEVLEDNWTKLKKFFYKSKEIIRNLITKSYIKYNTSNAKSKDSKRTGCLVFDEVHAYENYDQIKVFTSSFGKRKHSRAFYITTNGNVREGVLDDMINIATNILNGTITDLGWLPLMYRVDCEEDTKDEKMWHKPNPSLKYLPSLFKEIKKAYIDMQYTPALEEEFYTKRMNWPKGSKEFVVTPWENIISTSKEIPELLGRDCIVGIDYAMVSDMVSVHAHFRIGEERYGISHSWLCENSKDIKRIKAPYREWAEQGLLTMVDEVEISPFLVSNYVAELGTKYNIKKIALDNFRYALMKEALDEIGFDAKERKNLVLVRPSDIMKIVPVIDSWFVNQLISWGDNPLIRWATNNTKIISAGKKRGEVTGNFYYGKIEPKSRKTDPFMAFVASATLDDEIKEECGTYEDLPIIIGR